MRLQPVYLVVGCPGSGKSWVCEQLKDRFHYVHHDLFIGMAGAAYVWELFQAAYTADRPVLGEAPFSVSEIVEPLKAFGVKVRPVFISEAPQVIARRYLKREKKSIPKGHLTRQETYAKRAKAMRAFSGTSSEVLDYLKAVP